VQAGWSADGRSTVVRAQEIEPSERATKLVAGLALQGELLSPPASSAAKRVDLDADGRARYPPGIAGWAVRRHDPGEEFDMHYTATVDFDVVISGTTTLVLETGEVELGRGDCVLIDGVSHAWRAGPDGCWLSTVLVGKPIARAPEARQAH
jgi:mannose-6-phosphate isomerase-like protein (cupin superfamily)